MSFTYALKWSFLSEISSKIIQPIVFIVLARLLTPDDFGVMTAAMMVIAFSQIFWDAGMAKALIQRQTNIEEAANIAFVVNIFFGFLISCVMYLFAEPISRIFFHDERVTVVLRVMTLQVVLGAFCSVQTALLQREMSFKKLFWIRFVTISLPGLASVPLAWSGLGYWALVLGTLMGQLAQVIILWLMSDWRPTFKQNQAVTSEMVKFGAWVVLTGLLAWFFAWADSLMVGHYLGSHNLGLFNTGAKLPSIIFAMIFGPILPVLYSQLSKDVSDMDGIKNIAGLVIQTLTTISVPIAITLFVFSDHIETVVFGDKWHGLSIVFAAMAIMHGYSWIVGMNGEFYRALGKPSYETVVTAATLFIYLAVYILVINYGLEYFVRARAILAIGALALHLYILKRVLAINLWSVIKRIGLLTVTSLLIINFCKYVSIFFASTTSFQLVLGLSFSGVFMMLVIFFSEKKLITKLLLMAKRRSVIE